MASRSRRHATHSETWCSISTHWDRLSAWSRYAWSSSSGMCRTLLPLAAIIGVNQPLPGPGQGGSHRADREPGLLGDFRVTQAGVPQQQDFPVALGERGQGLVHLGPPLV